MTLPFFTIGHSDHSLDDFIGLLNGAGITRSVRNSTRASIA